MDVGNKGVRINRNYLGQASGPSVISLYAYAFVFLYRLFFPKGVSPRDRAIWLADVANKHRNLSVQSRMTAKSIIAVTRDLDTVKFLTEIGHPYHNTNMKLTRITEENKQTKIIIRNYPSYMPLDYIDDLPSVLWMERETRRDNRPPRNQVLALWEGEPPTTL